MSTIAASPALPRPRIDIGLALKQAARLFVKDLAPLLIAALIAGALGVLTLGILAGPLFAGLYGMVISRVRDGKTPEVGDVFSGLERFWSYAGAALVLVVLVALASITIVGGFLLATIWLYVFPLMVDRGLGLGEAMKQSKDLVLKAGFWEHLALVLVLFVIVSVANGALAILAAPFVVVAVSAAYFLASEKGEALEKA
jgi:hypothetical protein